MGKRDGTLALLATIRGGRAEERALHERFASHRKAGEWFALSPEIRAWLDEVRT